VSFWEQLTAVAALGQILVIAAGAFFAYQQINRLLRQQEAELIQRIFERLNEDQFAGALDFVYNDLALRLTESAYVREIFEGRATAASHREFVVMHFFNGLGLLVHNKMVAEYPIVFIVASPCMRAWDRLAPVVELLRRRYPHAYTPFESLVARSRAIDLAAINERFRTETPQLRKQWEATGHELAENRIQVLDDHAAG
jgi:hypothetical protein